VLFSPTTTAPSCTFCVVNAVRVCFNLSRANRCVCCIERARDRALVHPAGQQLPGHMRSESGSRLPRDWVRERSCAHGDLLLRLPRATARPRKEERFSSWFPRRKHSAPGSWRPGSRTPIEADHGDFSKERSGRCCNSLQFTTIGHQVEVSFQDLLLGPGLLDVTSRPHFGSISETRISPPGGERRRRSSLADKLHRNGAGSPETRRRHAPDHAPGCRCRSR